VIYKSKRQEQLAQRLYQQYGKPLEKTHWGEFVAISQEGKTVLGKTMVEALQKALKTIGPGTFLFKVGPKAVARM
jgi:hypothetical protein